MPFILLFSLLLQLLWEVTYERFCEENDITDT
jgi:hypothetical protein